MKGWSDWRESREVHPGARPSSGGAVSRQGLGLGEGNKGCIHQEFLVLAVGNLNKWSFP
jgi:hypothetical protein